MRQKVTGEQGQFEIWAYALRIINSNYFTVERVRTIELKLFGGLERPLPATNGQATDTDQIKLHLDAIPTIFFQMIIFIYDYFLFYLAESIETTIVKVKTSFLIHLTNSQGKRQILIDYKKWKDVSYKILEYFINFIYVRINEIVIIYQILVNVLATNPIYKMVRIILVAFYYSLIGFRQMKEYKVVVARIKVVLFWLQFFVWFRVIAGRLFHIVIEVYRVYLTIGVANDVEYYGKAQPASKFYNSVKDFLALD